MHFELEPDDFQPENESPEPPQNETTVDSQIVAVFDVNNNIYNQNRILLDDLSDIDGFNFGFVFFHILLGCNIRWMQFELHWHMQIG